MYNAAQLRCCLQNEMKTEDKNVVAAAHLLLLMGNNDTQTGVDCGQCPNCLDKPRFGGAGSRKQACAMRKCKIATETFETAICKSTAPTLKLSADQKAQLKLLQQDASLRPPVNPVHRSQHTHRLVTDPHQIAQHQLALQQFYQTRRSHPTRHQS
tara:strand:+ start:1671 stop:2135 length:465 start_codon:yes stop_codon:yes gene_type:complete